MVISRGVVKMTPPTPTPEQVANNIAEAKKNGYHLLCGGRFTWHLEREWDSILSIVPEEYAEARALANVDLESIAEEQAQDHYESIREAMD